MPKELIFEIKGKPVYVFHNGKFWISVKSIWKHLGTIERVFLFTLEQLQLSKADGGTCVPLDDFISICPQKLRDELNDQKERMIAATKE